MANQDFEIVYRGNPIRTIGVFQTNFNNEVPFTGTLTAVTVTFGGFSSFSGPWNLDFKLNGTLMGIDISIDGTDTTLQATGLSEAVTERDIIEPFITTLGGGSGSITVPVYITYTFTPTATTTLEDTDTIGTTKGATGAPASITGSSLKATTTEVLTGTGTTEFVTPDSLAAIWEKGSDIASAGTISIGEGGFFHVTGTTTITDIDPATDKAGRHFAIRFAGALTLTHHSTTLILPTGASITTAANDVAIFVSEGSDAVRCIGYLRADGTALVSGGFTAASTTEVLTGTDSSKGVTPDSLAALWEQGSDLASAGTISVGEGGYFNVTGTTTITDIDFGTTKAGRAVWLKFAGILTLTHNATTLILPSGASITTAAGDTACFISEGGDNVRCVAYLRADGTALVGGSFTTASTTEVLTGTDNAKGVTPDSLAAMWEQGSDIASAGTISVGEGGYFNVTGTTTITDIDPATDKAGRRFFLKFAGAVLLTHGASLILPTGANITTAAGDVVEFVSEGSDVVRCVSYMRADGTALVGTSGTAASTTEQLTGTDTAKFATADSVAALWEKGSDIASAGTISIGEGGFFHITGTTTITDIDFATDKTGRKVWLCFDGVLTLTHNASTLILPTGANISTEAGDTALFVSEGSDAVRCVVYQRKDGEALVGGSGTETWDTIFKTSDEARTNAGTGTTLTDDGQLVSGTLAAASRYWFKIYVKYSAESGTPGFKFRYNLSQTPVNSFFKVTYISSLFTLPSTTAPAWSYHGGASATGSTLTATGSFFGWAEYSGWVQTHATLTSVLAFQWAQNASSADDSTLYSGSHLMYALAA